MNDYLHLYEAFIEFITHLGKKNKLAVRDLKRIFSKHFKDHQDSEDLLPLIKKLTLDNESDINSSFQKCIRICDELGPSREYYTLINILEHVVEDLVEKSDPKTTELTKNVLESFKRQIAQINLKIPKPPLFNMLLEGRSLVEWTSIYAFYPFIPKRIKGDGRPVLLIPPYLGDDYSTSFVRRYLTSLGFKTYKWDQGVNLIKSHYIPRLEEKLEDIFRTRGQKVNIVGWSGGGLFAKIMANRHPDMVEQIVTIGSPVWGVMDMKTPVNGVLEFFRGKSLKERNKRFLEELDPIPNVPITCIYTKTDGLLPWKHCMEAESFRKDIANIEVYGSHSGLGANVSVLLITANALQANIEGRTVEDTTTFIERFLYPFYWNKKKRSLFFLN
ncbi:alpha/beta hydrolase [Muricauda sp. DJ-13]|uniref:Alpha/beta hydrolase n=2 Tax=Croceivirga thetidis TaxID=2721623 RepID=A0ABX1GNK1_9FLAO|nr:alpha/beta hydrolase [Croceivirga thetidis]